MHEKRDGYSNYNPMLLKFKKLIKENNLRMSQTAGKDQQTSTNEDTINIKPATRTITTTSFVKETHCQETRLIRHRKSHTQIW